MIYLAINEDGTPHKAYTRKLSARSRVDKHGGTVVPVELVVAAHNPTSGTKKPQKEVLLDLMPKSRGGFL